MTEMLESATEFKKSGFSDEESAQLAKIATLYQNVADSEISAGEASAYVISQMKAFDIQANDAISIIDKTNAVSNSFAVSSTDVSSALTKTSGAMATYGNTIDQTIGLVTAGTEILTGQAGKVSRGMRSVGAEIVKLANDTGEFSYQVNGATKTLSLFDETGKMLNTFEVLSKIYEDWNKMNEAEQSSLALTLGMKTQIDVLSATLSNFDSALEATATSEESHGSAMRENARYMESLESKVNNLKAQFQELILGEGGLSSFLKTIVDTGTGLLKFANSDVGQVIVKMTLLSTTLSLLNKGFNALGKMYLPNLIKDFIALKTGTQTVVASTLAMDMATQGFIKTLIASSKAWALSPFGMTTLAVGGVLALVKAIEYLSEATERQNEKVRDSIQQYEETNQEYEETKAKLDEINSKIEEINSQGGTNIANEEELEVLESQSRELENQLILLERKRQIEQDEASREAMKSLGKQTTSYYENQTTFSPTGLVNEGSPQSVYKYEELLNQLDALKALKSEIEAYEIQIENAKNSEQSDSQATADLILKKQELEDKYNNLSSSMADSTSTLDEQYHAIKDNKEAYSGLTDEQKDIVDSTGDAIDKVLNYTDALNNNSDASENNGNASEEMASSAEEASAEFEKAMDGLSSLSDAYDTLSSAIDEYNSTGSFSIGTIEDLLSLEPEYLSLLQFEDGQLSLNEEGLYALANARINEAEVEALHMAQSQMTALANGDLADSEIGVANASITASGVISEADSHIINLGIDAHNSAQNMLELMQALSNSKITLSQFTEGQKQVASNFANQINILEGFRANLGSGTQALSRNTGGTGRNTGATNKNTGARNANKDATKAQTEALKAQKKALEEEAKVLEGQIKDYEIVIDYVKDLLKEEQEALEEAKDKALEDIKAQIEAKEQEAEDYEDAVDKKIEALEEERDAQERYYDEQIDAIRKANQTLEENIKLQQLQEALARAKTQKVRVLKGGKFVYAQDEEVISKAEQELADYEMQLSVQKQIETLENLKKEALDSLDDQIDKLEEEKSRTKEIYDQELKDLQDHYDKVEKEYDESIKEYDAYMKQFEDMLNASARRHAEILYNELVGEQGNWDARLDALSNFVSSYEAKKNELDGIKAEIDNLGSQISNLEAQARSSVGTMQGLANDASGYSGAIQASLDDAMAKLQRWKVTAYNKNGMGTDVRYGSYDQMYPLYLDWAETGYYQQVKIDPYAKGSYSLPDDQIALIADSINPNNRELVIGSKINKGDGVMANLQKGTGIVPHGQTLTENLVNLANWAQNGGFERITNNNATTSQVVHIGTINLPNVQDGNDFVQYLQDHFVNDSIQFSNIRG